MVNKTIYTKRCKECGNIIRARNQSGLCEKHYIKQKSKTMKNKSQIILLQLTHAESKTNNMSHKVLFERGGRLG